MFIVPYFPGGIGVVTIKVLISFTIKLSMKPKKPKYNKNSRLTLHNTI